MLYIHIYLQFILIFKFLVELARLIANTNIKKFENVLNARNQKLRGFVDMSIFKAISKNTSIYFITVFLLPYVQRVFLIFTPFRENVRTVLRFVDCLKPEYSHRLPINKTVNPRTAPSRRRNDEVGRF